MQRTLQVVIIGGGFGGLRAARHLGDSDLEVTLIDKSNHHLFQPLLYQVATAGLSPADIAYPIRSILSDFKNIEVVWGEVLSIDPVNKIVSILDKNFPFDYLICATGAYHSYFAHETWAKSAPGLKTINDAVFIRQKILSAFEKAETETDLVRKNQWLTFVVIGAGPTGVEMAGAIAELSYRALISDFRHINPKSTRVILIEAGSQVLATFPKVLAKKAQQKLEEFGVEVRLNSRVQNIDGIQVTLDNEQISAQNIIWAAGVKASPAGEWLDAEVDKSGRVVVNQDLSVPKFPNIFVIGDTALVRDSEGRPLPGVAPVAMQQGIYVAKKILSLTNGEKFTRIFKYLDKGNLATVGRKFAVGEMGRFTFSGIFAWLIWLVVHIYYLIGFRNRVLVLFQWTWSYVTFQRGARLITGEKRRESA